VYYAYISTKYGYGQDQLNKKTPKTQYIMIIIRLIEVVAS